MSNPLRQLSLDNADAVLAVRTNPDFIGHAMGNERLPTDTYGT